MGPLGTFFPTADNPGIRLRPQGMSVVGDTDGVKATVEVTRLDVQVTIPPRDDEGPDDDQRPRPTGPANYQDTAAVLLSLEDGTQVTVAVGLRFLAERPAEEDPR